MDNKVENFGAQRNVNNGIQNNYFGENRFILPDTIPIGVGFVGREDYLRDLHETYERQVHYFVLHGIGGVGKTALALRFADEISKDFKAKIRVEMRGVNKNSLSWRDAMFEIVRQFNPEISADISDTHLKTYYVQYANNQPTLIILDNAENKQSVEALITANVCLIVTSRESFVLTGGKSFAIQKMSPKEARELLFEIADEERFDGRENELAQLGGYLPMALKPMASILAEDERETVKDLIEKFRDKKALLKERVSDYDDLSIAATFELSYEKLPVEMQKRWRYLSVFSSDFDEEAIASVLDISKSEAHETQKVLRDHSLLDLLKVNTQTIRFNLHDLVRVFTDEKLCEDERFQAQLLFAKYYVSILDRAEIMKQKREANYYSNALRLIDTEWNNIIMGQKWASEFIEIDNNIARLYLDYIDKARNFTILRLHPRQNIKWLELGLLATRKLNNPKAESAIFGNLGSAYYRLGEYQKAIAYQDQSSSISHEIGDQHGERVSLSNIGNIYFSLGEYRKTIAYQEQALVISREIGDRQAEGNILGGLGGAYERLGEYTKAIEYYEQSLDVWREIGDQQREGNSLNCLGDNYDKIGEYRKAIEYQDQALEIFREIGNIQGKVSALGGLGIGYDRLGEYQNAIKYHMFALIISREIGNRQSEGASCINLGISYFNLGEYTKAIEYYEQSLSISREIGDLNNECSSLVNLGNAYRKLGEKVKACSLWKKALAIWEGIESPHANSIRQHIKKNC